MPRIKVLPHAQICPEGAEFEVEHNANLCESLLKNGIKIEHACDMSCACTTCHVIVRQGFDSLKEMNDVEAEEGTITVYTAPTDLHKAIVALRESGIEGFQVTELEMIPQSEVELSGDDLETFEKLYSVLEDDEDVQKIYTNVDGF